MKTSRTRNAGKDRLERVVRARRLKKIKLAQESLEEELLSARNIEPTLNGDKAFGWLYYLLRLAKKAP